MMIYKKRLKKLDNKQLIEDIKKYIKSYYSFYETRVPELKVLAKRLHEEYNLKEFYNVFDKLWYSKNIKQISLAIYTIQLYKEDFDLTTWKFVKQKLKEIKSWDKVDNVATNIVGEILLKNPKITRDIIKLATSNDIWLKRIAIVSTIPLVRTGDFRLALDLIDKNLYNPREEIQKAVGLVLREIGDQKPSLLKRYVKYNINMPLTIFFTATENCRELRNLKNIIQPKNGLEKLIFWKN